MISAQVLIAIRASRAFIMAPIAGTARDHHKAICRVSSAYYGHSMNETQLLVVQAIDCLHKNKTQSGTQLIIERFWLG